MILPLKPPFKIGDFPVISPGFSLKSWRVSVWPPAGPLINRTRHPRWQLEAKFERCLAESGKKATGHHHFLPIREFPGFFHREFKLPFKKNMRFRGSEAWRETAKPRVFAATRQLFVRFVAGFRILCPAGVETATPSYY